MRNILCLLFVGMQYLSYSQVVNGIITDNLTSEHIPFVHIYSEKYKLGTLSNAEGKFSLQIPKQLQSSTLKLVFSHVSYGSHEQLLKVNEFNHVSLLSENILLDEVIVENEAFKMVLETVDILQKDEAIFGRAFYRQISYHDTIATEFVEAFYDIAANRNKITKIKQKQARFARRKTTANKPFMIYQNFPYATTMIKMITSENTSIITPFSDRGLEMYSFEIKERYENNEETYIVINCTPPDLNQSLDNLIFMDVKLTYSPSKNRLVEYDVIINDGLGNEDITGIDDSVNVKIENSQYRWKVLYGDKTGFINQIRTSYSYDFWIGNTKYPSAVYSNFFIYENTGRKIRGLSEPALDVLTIDNIEDAKYRPRFWNKNPIIKRTEKEEKIIQTFEAENAFGSYFK